MEDQQENDRLAALARAQVNLQNVGQQVRHPNPENDDLGVEELLNLGNPRRAEQIATPIRIMLIKTVYSEKDKSTNQSSMIPIILMME